MKKGAVFLFIALAVLILVCLISLNEVYATDIGWCANITSSDTYVLNASVNSAGTCMNISASNVTLDCNGFTINYSSSSVGYGVYTNSSNTTVKNCIINESSSTSTSHGIYFNTGSASNGTIYNNSVTTRGITSYGISLSVSSKNNLTLNNLTTLGGGSAYGIYTSSSTNNTITSNNITTSSTSEGIHLETNSNNDVLINNIVITTGNGAFGFNSLSSTNSTLTGNQFNTSSTISIYVTGTTSLHYNHSIDTSNLAEGLPIWYNYSVSDTTILSNIDVSATIGQLVCAWCTNVTYDNVTMGNDGFGFYNTSTSTINNSIVSTNKGYSVFVYGQGSSFLTNNIFNLLNIASTTNSYLYGFYFIGTSGNNVTNNNATSSSNTAYRIRLSSSSYNYLVNNSLSSTGTSSHGIYLSGASNNNTLLNNNITVTGAVANGINIDTGSSNIIVDNLIKTGIGESDYGIRISGASNNNNFTGINVTTNGTLGYAIYLPSTSTNNLFKDSYISSSLVADIYSSGAGGVTNFTNCTFNKSDTTITSTGSINVFWYADAYTNDAGGNPIDQANVSVYDINDILINWSLTNSSGYTPRLTLREYMQNATAMYYDTNYTYNTSMSGYNNSSQFVNLTGNRLFGINPIIFTLYETTNPVAYQGTNPVDNYNDTDGSITFDLKCEDNLAVSQLQLWTNTTGVWQVNQTNSSPSNNTFWNVTVDGIPDGYHVWAVYCNDTSGNTNITTNRTFTVDLTAPVATPGTSPVDNYNTSSQTITFDLKCADNIAVNQLMLYGNWSGSWIANQTNVSPSNNTFWNVSVVGIPEGIWRWAAYCNDTANLSDWSDTNQTFTVDLTAPVASQGVNPVDNYNSSSATVVFDAKCADNLKSQSLQIWANDTGAWHAITTQYNPANNTYYNLSVGSLTSGTFLWGARCNDSTGAAAWSANRTLTVDTQYPEINLLEPENDQEFNSGTTHIIFRWEVTDNLGSNISCNVYTLEEYQETIYCENATIYEQTIFGFSRGNIYTWQVNCSDGLNENVSESRDFTIARGYGGVGSSQNQQTNNTEPLGYNYTLGDLNKPRLIGIGLNEILKFGITSGNHTLKVIALTENNVTLMIWSNPIQFTLKAGETKQFDLNDNGYNDLEIIFTNISEGKANLLLTEIKSSVCGDGTCDIEELNCCEDCGCQTGYECKNNTCEVINLPDNTDSTSNWTWIIALIVVIIIAFLIHFIVSAAKKRRGY